MSFTFIDVTVFPAFCIEQHSPENNSSGSIAFSTAYTAKIVFILPSRSDRSTYDPLRIMSKLNDDKSKFEEEKKPITLRSDPCALGQWNCPILSNSKAKTTTAKFKKMPPNVILSVVIQRLLCAHFLIFTNFTPTCTTTTTALHTLLLSFLFFLGLLPSSKFTDNTAFDELFFI